MYFINMFYANDLAQRTNKLLKKTSKAAVLINRTAM